ncbi:hypothetical protein V1514DRAFT_337270 [Lipomyces japonicus]|uniref:uncharacterized protein n=1 Tax=Lipomyces japonicus TaxID=56871 RepID=UPI0034CF4BF5
MLRSNIFRPLSLAFRANAMRSARFSSSSNGPIAQAITVNRPRNYAYVPMLLATLAVGTAWNFVEVFNAETEQSSGLDVPTIDEAELDKVFDEAVKDFNIEPIADVLEQEKEKEEETEEYGAFNPKTGEINWDCPCLGGMAYGPCGDEFKAAFSCFVFSESEPKGVNCISLFETMQGCFRKHPEVYADDLRYIDTQQEQVAGEDAVEVAPAESKDSEKDIKL